MKKRGLSPIIATVLIVMITISAAAILVQFILPFVKDNLQKSTECLNVQDYFKFYRGEDTRSYNCLSGNDALMTLSAKNDNVSAGLIKGFDLAFVAGDSEKVEFPGSDNLHLLNNSKQVVLVSPGEIRTYNASLSKRYDSAEVYPVLANGRMCGISDKIKLEDCR